MVSCWMKSLNTKTATLCKLLFTLNYSRCKVAIPVMAIFFQVVLSNINTMWRMIIQTISHLIQHFCNFLSSFFDCITYDQTVLAKKYQTIQPKNERERQRERARAHECICVCGGGNIFETQRRVVCVTAYKSAYIISPIAMLQFYYNRTF